MLFTLDGRLENDGHLLFEWQSILFLLNKNATIPWIILVPKTNESELLDLPKKTFDDVFLASRVTQNFLKAHYKIDKINFASIGNVVSQLHVHIVGRRVEDYCWPDVIWGKNYPKTEYSNSEINQIKQQLLIKLK